MDRARGIPDLMRSLPIDRRRGLPIPASTARYPDGEPKFSLVDGREALCLAVEGRCGICGNRLDAVVAFLGAPEATATHVYHDPPMHEQCAEASTKLCPHLAHRDMRRVADRRSAETPSANNTNEKPDRWVMWICRGFAADVVDGIPIFLPTPYIRLRTFTYTDDGHLHESPDMSPRA